MIIKFFRRSKNFLRNHVYCAYKRRLLKNHNFSLITSDCSGGMIYHDLQERFLSPTVNCKMSPKDFIKFCNDIEFWLLQPVTEIKLEGVHYPVGQLGDSVSNIVIHFVHYRTFEEAKQKWNERKQRINYNNIFILLIDRDCTEEDVSNFMKLKYKNKLIVSNIARSYNNYLYIKGYEDSELPIMTAYCSRWSVKKYLDIIDYVGWLNHEKWCSN